MRKQTKRNLIIGFFLVVALLLVAHQLNLLTIFYGVNQLACGFSGDIITCSSVGAGSQGNEFGENDPNTLMTFQIDSPYNLYFKKFSGFQSFLISHDYKAQEFFNLNPNVCYSSSSLIRIKASDSSYVAGVIISRLDEWQQVFGINGIESSYWNGDWCGTGPIYTIFPGTIVKEKFPNQLIIIEGNLLDRREGENPTVSIPFKTYGFCNLISGICMVKSPVINIKTFPTGASHAQISSIKIPLKIGGYDETTVCVENGIEKCVGNELYRCSNYGFYKVGQIEGKCGYETPKTFYKFENNNCSQVSILPSEKTENDYQTLNECQEKITSEPVKNNTFLFIAIGLLVLIFVLIIIFVKIKKRK